MPSDWLHFNTGTEMYCHLSQNSAGYVFFYILKNIYLFIYLFLAELGLCCCVWASSSCSQQGLLFPAVRRLLIAVASLVAEHGL